MRYDVKITKKATADLDAIYYYISSELVANKAAIDLLNRIESLILGLQDFPYAYSLVKEELLQLKGYRKLVVGSYSIFYTVIEKDKRVIVMRILYSRRNYNEFL
ncbi:type II toxin-antitoxin system RelE/ParE family toxin [Sporosarcina saromensis]|uniref:Type II toxin-antitoxin system RelE/ParE family toxin n=1 Tax=Sporosarcina saromensis TaxID=359365 RepID=A0ABU4G887_9BACL|nr:type II toxin-antitoxin system RelE/ParE family toxin [Sporosarcina saromensis]MDW0113190.1 type II toxin-antitoxin system RelE/ParE family toxin [Sporosarcina saromensis]